MTLKNTTRRGVLKGGALAGAGLALPTILTAASHAGYMNAPTGSSVTLGFNVPQTGPYADEGADELRAYELAVEHLNGGGDGGAMQTFSSKALNGSGILGKKVEFVTGDTQTKSDAARAWEHYSHADNMTDRMAALYLGCALDGEIHDKIVGDFYERYKSYPLVIDKWFSAQAMIHLPKTIQTIKKLKEHTDFNIKNPNRVRSLYSAFAMNNPVRFHAADGSGYDFLTDGIIELNAINPQIAARLLTPMRDWKRYTEDRQIMLKAALVVKGSFSMSRNPALASGFAIVEPCQRSSRSNLLGSV